MLKLKSDGVFIHLMLKKIDFYLMVNYSILHEPFVLMVRYLSFNMGKKVPAEREFRKFNLECFWRLEN